MKNVEVCVRITIKPMEASVDADRVARRMEAGRFRLVLDEGSLYDIDALEAGVSGTSYETMRDALAEALERASRDKAREVCGEKGGSVRCSSTEVTTGSMAKWIGFGSVCSMWWMRPVRGSLRAIGYGRLAGGGSGTRRQVSRSWRSWGGATRRSYRKTVEHFNRSRHQEVGGTPLNSLRDGAEREGRQVIGFPERRSERVLSAHRFGADARPEPGAGLMDEPESFKPKQSSRQRLDEALVSVGQAMRQRGLDEELIEEVKQHSHDADYEQREDTVNIAVDDVGVKEQKAKRVRRRCERSAAQTEAAAKSAPVGEGSEAQAAAGKKRPTAHNTVARIERPGQRFTLTGTGVAQVLRFVSAFLLTNALPVQRLKVFTDGQRHLQGSLPSFFSRHPRPSLILDWFHLVRKFKEDLSLARRGREIRNRHLKVLLGLLWFGLLDRAQEHLRSIASAELKNPAPIERLIGYLERNRSGIPCYALRRESGLANSGNPVERANNPVTSNRQKHRGMSWSKPGSHALTALSAVVLNGATRSWARNRVVPFKFVAGAA